MVLAQRDFIGRRELLVALGSAAETWPLAGRAQQSATSIPRVGWLVTGSPAEYRFSLAAHGCQRLLAGGRPVRQFNPFFVRQDAVSEVEMEEIKRHMTLLDKPLD